MMNLNLTKTDSIRLSKVHDERQQSSKAECLVPEPTVGPPWLRGAALPTGLSSASVPPFGPLTGLNLPSS